ncbi:ABC transporter substrate-binding protein [Winogradskyella sp.]|uniref:ABC transporter substrate-binding protein n=1 Tax=Winogradskyella sp. TaxID=1883156 RepID=UPI0025FE6E99|nr:ABC transporter substrate-binding protein [Winogradskyella sp.]MCT4630733.1 ABC transporter substrate-binding protein [Winogradskyella sp.]
MKFLRIILITLLVVSCKNETKKADTTPILTENNAQNLDTVVTQLKYAKGFTIKNYTTHKTLNITKPWPEATTTYKYLIASKKNLAKISYSKDEYNGIITNDISKLVVTSTTHIPALELLGVEKTLVGFPGTDYISSEKTRQRIDAGEVRELGKNEGINTEVLLTLNPDVVIGFGVDGINKTFETLKKAGVPVIYNGDWVEASALAKAEWIKFFGLLFNKEKEADSIFNNIEKDYLEAKRIALQAQKRPTILSGAMHNGSWFLPNGSSAEAQFLKDANVNYLWSNTTGKGSLSLSFETVFNKAQHANLWLSPSYYTNFNQLKDASELYANFDAFKNKSIYTFSNTTGATGGVLYYELGTIRPDLVLKDLIKICHPELLEDYTPYFFKKLND